MIEMKVKDCLKVIDGEVISGTGDKVFRGVSIDSRILKKNELFVFCPYQINDNAPPTDYYC